MEKKTMKNYNAYLWTYIIINAIIVYFLLSEKKIAYSDIKNIDDFLTISLVNAGGLLLAFFMNGFVNSDLKAKMVFRKRKNFLPGCHAFTIHINNDLRIDKNKLINEYGELPSDEVEQNRLWYKMYKECEFEPSVFDSQRNFLIARDITSLSVLILVTFILTALFFKYNLYVSIKIITVLFLEYIIASVVSKNYAIRYVKNVMAIISNR
jgi:hypothetical protein